ncbi:MAG: hypothetical protein FK734_19745 [Asgard group archaeon]|nr:hypothetical protein [Asgard group archaeon]
MNSKRIFSIASIITFFALLPALIVIQVRTLRIMPEITYLFVIMDVILVAFMALEIFLIVREWKKEKAGKIEKENHAEEEIIEKEWNEEKTQNDTNGS